MPKRTEEKTLTINNDLLCKTLHLDIEDGFEIIAIKDVISVLKRSEDKKTAKIIEERLVKTLFEEGFPHDQELVDALLEYYGGYEELFSRDSLIYDKNTASMVGVYYLMPSYKKEAMFLLKELAKEGYPNAQFLYGQKLLANKRTRYEGRYYLHQAKDKGYVPAKADLGFSIYLDGTEDGFKTGKKLLEEAAQEGVRKGWFLKTYADLIISDSDNDEDAFQQSLEEAMKLCDEGYYKGYSIISSFLNDSDHHNFIEIALPFLEKAAEYGYEKEAHQCARFYSERYDATEDQDDLKKAFKYIKTAIRSGGRDENLDYSVILLKLGRYEDARELLEFYANKGVGFALRELGLMSQRGLGEEENYDKAVSLYTRAIQAGYESAEYDIAYAKWYLKQDPTCIDTFIKGGEAGYKHCYYALARIYEEGEIVEADKRKSEFYKNLGDSDIENNEINGIA